MKKPTDRRSVGVIRACSRESRRPPKPLHGVRLLALVLRKKRLDGVTDRIGPSEGPGPGPGSNPGRDICNTKDAPASSRWRLAGSVSHSRKTRVAQAARRADGVSRRVLLKFVVDMRPAGVLERMAAFEAAGRGSNPRRGTKRVWHREGEAPAEPVLPFGTKNAAQQELRLPEIQLSSECGGSHATLRRSRTRFESWRGHLVQHVRRRSQTERRLPAKQH
jgi:hypothetical protein